MKPYYERILSENVTLRGFSEKIDPEQLTWHRDAENRIIIVVEGNGWMFQRDNEIPILMEAGDRIKVNAGEYHRVIKGEDDLIVTIIKESLWKNIHAKKKRGEKSNPRSKSYKAAKKAGEKINKEKNESKKDQNNDGENDFEDVKIARMKASGMSDAEIKKKYPELFNEINLEEKRKRKKRKKRKSKKSPEV